MDDVSTAAGVGPEGARSGGSGGAAGAVARTLADLTGAPAPTRATVGPLAVALAIALDQGATEGPYAAAETELTRRMSRADDGDLRALMLTGAALARALRWSGRQDATLLPGVRDLLDRAAAELPPARPTESWLTAGLSLFGAQLSLTVRTGDAQTARAAARLAGVLGTLLDRHPELAAAMASTVTVGASQVGVPGDAAAVREALRMLEQLLPMLAALSSLSLADMPFPLGVPSADAGTVFVASQRAQPASLPPADRTDD